MLWSEVDDHDVGEAEVRVQPIEQRLQRGHTPRRRTDCADRSLARTALLVPNCRIVH